MKKIFLIIPLLIGFANADINDTMREQCQKVVDSNGKYEVPVDSYINGAITGVLTAVDNRYHRKQIVAKRTKLMTLACKEAFLREDDSFESGFVKGVLVTVDRRWTRFRKAR